MTTISLEDFLQISGRKLMRVEWDGMNIGIKSSISNAGKSGINVPA